MKSSLPAPHMYRRRATPWPVRIFLVIAVLFGIWVDATDPDLTTSTAERIQTPMQGPVAEHSVVDNIIRTLASRR